MIAEEDKRCGLCDWSVDDGELFIYCNNPNRTIESATHTSEEDSYLVDMDDTCDKWIAPNGMYDDPDAEGHRLSDEEIEEAINEIGALM